MSIFDKAYDEMTMTQICSRLPGELAVRALRRRILNLDTLFSFVEVNGISNTNIKELKNHINDIFANSSLDDIFNTFKQDLHPTLFQWLNADNTKRIKTDAKDKLTTTFRFNLTDSDDVVELSDILEKVLSEDIQNIVPIIDPNCADCTAMGNVCGVHCPPIGENSSKRIRAILEKANTAVFQTLADRVLSDKRAEVRASVLGLFNSKNNRSLTDNQNIIALKAFAKMADTSSLRAIKTLNYRVFTELRPLERLTALQRYLGYFPEYRKLLVFEPMPSLEEFKFLLFSCTVEHYEKVQALINQFRNITELDPPVVDDDGDDI
jgi:hypothetical protein